MHALCCLCGSTLVLQQKTWILLMTASEREIRFHVSHGTTLQTTAILEWYAYTRNGDYYHISLVYTDSQSHIYLSVLVLDSYLIFNQMKTHRFVNSISILYQIPLKYYLNPLPNNCHIHITLGNPIQFSPHHSLQQTVLAELKFILRRLPTRKGIQEEDLSGWMIGEKEEKGVEALRMRQE